MMRYEAAEYALRESSRMYEDLVWIYRQGMSIQDEGFGRVAI